MKAKRTDFKNATPGSTVTMLKDGVETQVIVTHVSRSQIDIRFLYYHSTLGYTHGHRSFTTKGEVRYMPDEKGKTKLLSLDIVEPTHDPTT